MALGKTLAIAGMWIMAVPFNIMLAVLAFWYLGGDEFFKGKPDIDIRSELVGGDGVVAHGETFYVRWWGTKVYNCPAEFQRLLVNTTQVNMGYLPRGLFGGRLGPYSHAVSVYVGPDVKPGEYTYAVDGYFWCNPIRPIRVWYEGPKITVVHEHDS